MYSVTGHVGVGRGGGGGGGGGDGGGAAAAADGDGDGGGNGRTGRQLVYASSVVWGCVYILYRDFFVAIA